MPYYDYKCKKCKHEINDYKKGINDPHLILCPKCHTDSLTQAFNNHNSSVQYKGKGWFKTDGKY